jgi:triosephosphate isomerase
MIIANWKCNGSKSMINHWWKEFSKTYNETDNTFIGIAPPSIYIQYLEGFTSNALTDIKIGSQDIDISSGGRTGAISAEMIMDFDCKFSIIGHSERRQFFNENNDDIRQKILNIINKKITVLCIGETEDENYNNLTKDVLESQLEVIRDMDFNDSLVVAYEPVWSIGSGNTAQPGKINEIHNFIKDVVQSTSINSAIPIVIYGGSVNEDNAESFFNEEFIDGALIGGASLNGKQFANIINIYNGINS